MKTVELFPFLIISSLFILSCDNQETGNVKTSNTTNALVEYTGTKGYNEDAPYTLAEYNNTKGYFENGEIIKQFDCPDAIGLFPPINIKSWNKIPIVNGRLPTYEETKNGKSIHHYGEGENPDIRPYNMALPKLAYRRNPLTNLDNDIVVVIQIVQTSKDTIVGYRYLTGGVGGSVFSDFRFLADREIAKAIE